jgi:hypothetical protein
MSVSVDEKMTGNTILESVLPDNTEHTGLAWRDIIGFLNVDVSAQNSANLGVFRAGAVRQFSFQADDKIDLVYHLPHDYAPGTDLYIHMHWGHNGTAISGAILGTFSCTYAKGYDQQIFGAEKVVTAGRNVVNIATTPRYGHFIDEVKLSTPGGSVTELNTNELEVDGLILVNFTMTTIPTISGGTPNEPYVFTCDIHYQSTDLGTLNKNYPFYV